MGLLLQRILVKKCDRHRSNPYSLANVAHFGSEYQRTVCCTCNAVQLECDIQHTLTVAARAQFAHTQRVRFEHLRPGKRRRQRWNRLKQGGPRPGRTGHDTDWGLAQQAAGVVHAKICVRAQQQQVAAARTVLRVIEHQEIEARVEESVFAVSETRKIAGWQSDVQCLGHDQIARCDIHFHHAPAVVRQGAEHDNGVFRADHILRKNLGVIAAHPCQGAVCAAFFQVQKAVAIWGALVAGDEHNITIYHHRPRRDEFLPRSGGVRVGQESPLRLAVGRRYFGEHRQQRLLRPSLQTAHRVEVAVAHRHICDVEVRLAEVAHRQRRQHGSRRAVQFEQFGMGFQGAAHDLLRVGVQEKIATRRFLQNARRDGAVGRVLLGPQHLIGHRIVAHRHRVAVGRRTTLRAAQYQLAVGVFDDFGQFDRKIRVASKVAHPDRLTQRSDFGDHRVISLPTSDEHIAIGRATHTEAQFALLLAAEFFYERGRFVAVAAHLGRYDEAVQIVEVVALRLVGRVGESVEWDRGLHGVVGAHQPIQDRESIQLEGIGRQQFGDKIRPSEAIARQNGLLGAANGASEQTSGVGERVFVINKQPEAAIIGLAAHVADGVVKQWHPVAAGHRIEREPDIGQIGAAASGAAFFVKRQVWGWFIRLGRGQDGGAGAHGRHHHLTHGGGHRYQVHRCFFEKTAGVVHPAIEVGLGQQALRHPQVVLTQGRKKQCVAYPQDFRAGGYLGELIVLVIVHFHRRHRVALLVGFEEKQAARVAQQVLPIEQIAVGQRDHLFGKLSVPLRQVVLFGP